MPLGTLSKSCREKGADGALPQAAPFWIGPRRMCRENACTCGKRNAPAWCWQVCRERQGLSRAQGTRKKQQLPERAYEESQHQQLPEDRGLQAGYQPHTLLASPSLQGRFQALASTAVLQAVFPVTWIIVSSLCLASTPLFLLFLVPKSLFLIELII